MQDEAGKQVPEEQYQIWWLGMEDITGFKQRNDWSDSLDRDNELNSFVNSYSSETISASFFLPTVKGTCCPPLAQSFSVTPQMFHLPPLPLTLQLLWVCPQSIQRMVLLPLTSTCLSLEVKCRSSCSDWIVVSHWALMVSASESWMPIQLCAMLHSSLTPNIEEVWLIYWWIFYISLLNNNRVLYSR